MYTVKISQKKKEKLTEHAEKALKHLGKLMQCVEELGEDDGMGERYNYRNGSMGGGNMGGRYGNRMGERDDWDDDDDDDYPMGERRRRSSSGRYM